MRLFFVVELLFVKGEIFTACYHDVDGHNNGLSWASKEAKKNANIYDINVKFVFTP